MTRDEQFEVQYLLSLTVVILALTTSDLEYILDEVVGLGFFGISSIHLIVLTGSYTLEKATESTLNITNSIKTISNRTLQVTTLSFIYVVVHIGTYSILSDKFGAVYGISASSVQTVITFGVPFLPVMVILVWAKWLLATPLQASRDLSLNVVPNDVQIFRNFDDGEPILAELLNRGENEYDITLHIQLPEGVVAEIDWEEYEGEYRDKFTLSDERYPLNIQLRHNHQERKREVIRLTAEHPHGKLKERVDCFIRP